MLVTSKLTSVYSWLSAVVTLNMQAPPSTLSCAGRKRFEYSYNNKIEYNFVEFCNWSTVLFKFGGVLFSPFHSSPSLPFLISSLLHFSPEIRRGYKMVALASCSGSGCTDLYLTLRTCEPRCYRCPGLRCQRPTRAVWDHAARWTNCYDLPAAHWRLWSPALSQHPQSAATTTQS